MGLEVSLKPMWTTTVCPEDRRKEDNSKKTDMKDGLVKFYQFFIEHHILRVIATLARLEWVEVRSLLCR